MLGVDMTDDEFAKVVRLSKTYAGLHLDQTKRPLVRSRLARRLRSLGLSNYSNYCDLIQDSRHPEVSEFVTALTTNVTHFFREAHHFTFLKEKVFPRLIARAELGDRIRIWSAGCSTGQEPYSIAALLLSMKSTIGARDIRIIATDIDQKALSIAQGGVYKRHDDADLSRLGFGSIFSGSPHGNDGMTVRDEVRKLVEFQYVNLVGSWSFNTSFDIIFCRNVVIYFDRQTQARLWCRFTDSLKESGLLFVGHSERVHGEAKSRLLNVGVTVYEKR